jgi:hypothetical protein
MSQPDAGAGRPAGDPPVSEGQLAQELAQIPYEPLLPAEKKLIAGSLLLGALLLGVLLWLSSAYFPATPPASGDQGSRPPGATGR